MKLLYVITKATWGGAQRYVFDLACAAQEKGYDVAVVYGEPGPLADKLQTENIRTIPLPEMHNEASLGAVFSAKGALQKLFVAERPDVVHLNSSLASAAGALAARSAEVSKIIFTAHGWVYNENRPIWQKFAVAVFHYLTVLIADRTIVVSHAILRDAAWMPFVQKKFTLIYHGISEPSFVARSEARERLLPSNKDAFLIGIVGELHPTKRAIDAIDAVALLKQEIPTIHLLVAGEGTFRSTLEKRIAEKGVAAQVTLLGYISEIATCLKAFDIFVMPSWTEALGYAAIEASYAGLPSIVTRVGGLPEVVEDKMTGFLIPRGNPTALADAVRKLYTDPVLRSHMGAAARARAIERFSLPEMIEKTFALY